MKSRAVSPDTWWSFLCKNQRSVTNDKETRCDLAHDGCPRGQAAILRRQGAIASIRRRRAALPAGRGKNAVFFREVGPRPGIDFQAGRDGTGAGEYGTERPLRRGRGL